MKASAKKRPTATVGATASNRENTLAHLAQATLRGGVGGLVTALVLSLIAALIAYLNADPNALVWPLALGSLALSCIVAGFLAQKAYRAAPVVSGGVCALALLIVFWLLGALLPDGAGSPLSAGVRWGMRGGAVGFCVLGSLMATNLPRGKRVKRKKRK